MYFKSMQLRCRLPFSQSALSHRLLMNFSWRQPDVESYILNIFDIYDVSLRSLGLNREVK